MKLKRILATIAATAIAIASLSTVAWAADYGTPTITQRFEYPADPDGDGSEYLAVYVGYEGFTGLSRANNTGTSGAAITAIASELIYDEEVLTFEFADNAGNLSGTIGGTKPTWTMGVALNRNAPYAASNEFMVAYFSFNNDFDKGVDATDFSYLVNDSTVGAANLQITVTSGSTDGQFSTRYVGGTVGEGMEGEYEEKQLTWAPFYYGTKAPAVKEYNVTAENATVSASKAAAGTTITVTPNAAHEGHEIETVTVNDTAIEATNGAWTFEMPAADAVVEVTYKFFGKATEGEMLYLKKGEEKTPIKTFDCTVENCEDGIVKLYFNDKNVWDNFNLGITGGTKVEFTALVLNVPSTTTLPELQISDN